MVNAQNADCRRPSNKRLERFQKVELWRSIEIHNISFKLYFK